MPRKPKHPCRYPGCPNLTDDRYCSEHRKKSSRDYERYGRSPDTRKRYGRDWRKIRARYVKSHPFCEICYQEKRLVPVEQVHHIIPLAEGGTHASSNLVSLCRSCHSRIHAKRGDRWNNHGGKEYPKGEGE